jgi:hypothetical protein
MACATTRFEFDILAKRFVHSAVLLSRVTYYSPITALDQSDVEFVISCDTEMYVDLDIHISLRRKLVVHDGSSLEPANSTTVVNNLFHSLYCQCNVTINGVSISSFKFLNN